MRRHWYEQWDENFGEITNVVDGKTVEFVLGKDKKSNIVSILCCEGFKPEIGDKVEMFSDDDAGWVLVKH